MVLIPLKKGIIALLVDGPFPGVVKVGHDICLVINNKREWVFMMLIKDSLSLYSIITMYEAK